MLYDVKCSCGNQWVANDDYTYTKCFKCGRLIRLRSLKVNKEKSPIYVIWSLFIGIGLIFNSIFPDMSTMLIIFGIIIFIYRKEL